MKTKAFFGGGFAAVTYLAVSEDETEAVVIDPAVPCATVLSARSPMPRITAILLTHGHFDHMLTLTEWKEKTGAPICIAGEDAPALSSPTLNASAVFFGKGHTYPTADRLLSEGDTVIFGGEKLTVMQTPGHTPGSCLYVGAREIFTGDTVMADGGFGRYDLPGGSVAALRESLGRIMRLSGDYRLYPGHGRDTTLNEEKAYYKSIN